jgi:hypothetical protein
MAPARTIRRLLLEGKILRNICDHLRDDRASLFALACSCRAFLNPTLDVLWSVQASLAPLVKCLPADAWEERIYVEPRSPETIDYSEEDYETDGFKRLVELSFL